MCGIAGFVGKGGQEELKKMTDSIIHRGPDDAGFYYKQFEDSRSVGLGFRRLSIIDLATGNQPIFNEDKSIAVIFNGEIYNWQKIRDDLIRKGHIFTTKTDTEVIVHLYEEMGEKCFEKFNGMFAVAIWDNNCKKLVLARDKMGKKPLYYYFDGKNLIFGSEIKALLANHFFNKELDLRSLNEYLQFEYIPTPHSIFKNTSKLSPGSYLVLEKMEITVKKFWDIEFYGEQIPSTEGGVLNHIEEIIDDAVKIRLMSDVPLGVFLSGGIDSSTIAYYAQKNSTSKIKTFSIGFNEKSFDESVYAKQVANYLGTEHYSEILSSDRALELVSGVAGILDEPLADASIIPTYLLSKFARQQVTVVLGGDGGDELFLGYSTFLAHKLAGIYKKIPKFLRKNFVEKLVQSLPTRSGYFSFDFKVKQFIKGFDYKPEYRNQIWLGSFDKFSRSELLCPEVWNSVKNFNEFETIDNEICSMNGAKDIDKIIKLYQRQYMMDGVLVKVDRASMAASLEVRDPFLDFRLVNYLNSVPFELKMKGSKTKYLLKKMMNDKLPAEIINRKKQGFSLPLADWFRKDLKNFVIDVLSKNNIERQGIFDFKYVEKIMADHFSGKVDNRKLLWTLIVFEMWNEKWLKN